jgi:hypothetical protein
LANKLPWPPVCSDRTNDSSGFEHVFVGEVRPGPDGVKQVIGMHNWIMVRGVKPSLCFTSPFSSLCFTSPFFLLLQHTPQPPQPSHTHTRKPTTPSPGPCHCTHPVVCSRVLGVSCGLRRRLGGSTTRATSCPRDRDGKTRTRCELVTSSVNGNLVISLAPSVSHSARLLLCPVCTHCDSPTTTTRWCPFSSRGWMSSSQCPRASLVSGE